MPAPGAFSYDVWGGTMEDIGLVKETEGAWPQRAPFFLRCEKNTNTNNNNETKPRR